jgi:ATP-binding cassette subfamily E protein 1
MSRLAIVDYEKCKPTKCNKECMSYCPPNRQGVKCVTMEDIEDIGKKASISNAFCIGCGICTKKCPFGAINIVNIPQELDESRTLYSYGENSFRVYNPLSIKKGACIGLLGSNGLGKSTILKILAGKIKIDLKDKKLRKMLGSQEIFKYISLKNNTVSYKPQEVLKISKLTKKVSDVFDSISSEYIKHFKLSDLANRRFNELSGGEIQRLLISLSCSEKANTYLFDEPSAFLDIKQRVKMANALMNLRNDNYVVCIDHDLCIFDYICDYVACMYGEPSCYGVITSLYSTFNGINSYLDGYFKKENVKFRKMPIKFKIPSLDTQPMKNKEKEKDNEQGEKIDQGTKYKACTIDYSGKFKLNVEKGSFRKGQVILLIGENGTGKSTFINMLAGDIKTKNNDILGKIKKSYKKQHPTVQGVVEDMTVEDLLSQRGLLTNATFKTLVIKPLKVSKMLDTKISELSGGQMQRLCITLCLGKSSDIYLLDEPSAYIDVDDRMHVAKIIRRYARMYGKTIFIVEHDIVMASCIADNVILFSGQPSVECTAHTPQDMNIGINEFLKSINITMRKARKTGRPRINKYKCQQDVKQRKSGQYFMLD